MTNRMFAATGFLLRNVPTFFGFAPRNKETIRWFEPDNIDVVGHLAGTTDCSKIMVVSCWMLLYPRCPQHLYPGDMNAAPRMNWKWITLYGVCHLVKLQRPHCDLPSPGIIGFDREIIPENMAQEFRLVHVCTESGLVRETITFCGPTIQVSELLYFTQCHGNLQECSVLQLCLFTNELLASSIYGSPIRHFTSPTVELPLKYPLVNIEKKHKKPWEISIVDVKPHCFYGHFQ